jgi:hypothetical protein
VAPNSAQIAQRGARIQCAFHGVVSVLSTRRVVLRAWRVRVKQAAQQRIRMAARAALAIRMEPAGRPFQQWQAKQEWVLMIRMQTAVAIAVFRSGPHEARR